MKASGRMEMPKGAATLVSRPVSNAEHRGVAECIKMSAQMVAWKVSAFVFKCRTPTALLADVIATSGKVMRGIYHVAAGLIANVNASPGANAKGKYIPDIALKAAPNTAPPKQLAANVSSIEEISAKFSAGVSSEAKADAEAATVISADMDSSAAATMGDMPLPVVTNLKARLITWVAPEMVDEKTLYIVQVYETELDGNTLILK